ncbi:MAG TPA: RNA-binding S4 domain-containing protein [Kofleriaceae bacterium]|nr:RNA-binding S4 domain-containing protein [Kofleriaceae bacterium]
MTDEPRNKVRLDKWLWAARFYKTRSQSAAAIKAGRVELGGVRAKASQQVGVGARVEVRKGPYLFVVEVRALAERRGSAEMAQRLYDENPADRDAREATQARLTAERADAPPGWGGRGRPTKKQRRELDAFRDRIWSPEDLDDDD